MYEMVKIKDSDSTKSWGECEETTSFIIAVGNVKHTATSENTLAVSLITKPVTTCNY